jgi:hypothetical protein
LTAPPMRRTDTLETVDSLAIGLEMPTMTTDNSRNSDDGDGFVTSLLANNK